ncbi:transposase, partial [Streptomyces sp. NPDC057144]|uniref:transposase n=1 Tax=Streptomyces sp. NPDC057144 TaxID=3346034 RepID=UPI003631C1F7
MTPAAGTDRVPAHAEASWRIGERETFSCSARTRSTRPFRLDQSVGGPGVPLTDARWARIEPLLRDRTPKRGGRRRDHREVIDAIAFKFQTGTQWCTCRRSTATGEASTTGCGRGPSTAPGSGCSPPWWPRPTPTRTSAGPCPWTPPSC